MKSHLRLISFTSFAALLITGAGCTEIRTIQKSEVNPDGDERILVFTRNGSKIRFEQGRYTVDTSRNSRSVKGDGVFITSSENDHHQQFSGSISFSEIDSIYAQQFWSVGESIGFGIALLGLTFTVLLILAWIHGPISIG